MADNQRNIQMSSEATKRQHTWYIYSETINFKDQQMNMRLQGSGRIDTVYLSVTSQNVSAR